MRQWIIYAVNFILLWSFVSGNQQHSVCKTIQYVFTDDESSESLSRVRILQGPPGKTGIPGNPGIQGLPGPSGPSAVVDYNRINRVVADKVASAVAEINSRMNELERNFTEFRGSPSCKAKGGFSYGQKCYTIPHLSSSPDMDYSEAVAECAKTGALLAEIHDRTQQKALHDFAFSKMPSERTHFFLWVGMIYKRSKSTLLYRSGKQIPSSQLQWDTGSPASSSSRKYLALEVGNDGDSSVGLWNGIAGASSHGVLCENIA